MELELRDVVVRRGGRSGPLALDGVSLAIAAGERIAMMGANGAGKSTLGLVLAGALPITRGSVVGTSVEATRAVLQRPEASFLAERVIDEVAFGEAWNGAPHANAHRTALAMLERLGLGGEFADRDPLTLSGGEQRRVAIAGVLATDPRVVILDEPSAGLDAAARRSLLDVIAGLHGEGRTVVTITHDADEAARVADRLIVLAAGRIVYDGAIDAVLGDPAEALRMGLVATPEVRVLRALAIRGALDVPRVAHPDRALELAVALNGAARVAVPAAGAECSDPVAPRGGGHVPDPRVLLAPSIDARIRIVATLAAMVAALLAQSVVAAGIVTAALVAVMWSSPRAREHARVAIRPIATIAVMLVIVQFAFGRHIHIDVIRGVTRTSPLLVAAHRVFQVGSVLIASLTLTAATTAQDVGAALRTFLRPLRGFRIPVDDLALVVATSLAILPALDAELDRIRMARSARGIRARGRGPVARIRLESLVLMPLLVTSFRRARLLADALVVRGADPRSEPIVWRPRIVPGSDLVGLVSAMILLIVAWFV